MIFDLFTRAHRSAERPQGGLGIGLSLVRNLVELHGGSVEAKSAGAKQGSEFIVQAAAARSGRRARGSRSRPSPDAKRRGASSSSTTTSTPPKASRCCCV